MRHGPIQVFVKPDVPKDLLSLMKKYAKMLLVIRLDADFPLANLRRLTMFLSGFCYGLEMIRKCTSLCDVIDLLVDKMKIYIFNIDTLSACSEYFDSDEMKGSIEQYEQQLDEFLSATTIKEFKGTLKTKIVDPNDVESIVLKLDESRTDDTLENLKTLVQHFFGSCKKEIILCDVRPGCVCIMWLAPVSLVPTLRTMADQHSRSYLASQGVLELVIGLRIAPNEGLHSFILVTLISLLLNYRGWL